MKLIVEASETKNGLLIICGTSGKPVSNKEAFIFKSLETVIKESIPLIIEQLEGEIVATGVGNVPTQG